VLREPQRDGPQHVEDALERTALRIVWLVFCLIFFTGGGAFLGGAGAVDSGCNVVVGMTGGALVGVFLGLVFGGVRGKWLDYFFGPEGADETATDHDNHLPT
jgi:hypothetical protein